jgi:hypothetical protein
MFIRRLPSFEYHAPASIQEALIACLNALARRGFAGKRSPGFDEKKKRVPEHLINLKGIEG